MKTKIEKHIDIREMAEKYRKIRSSQPSISLDEMRAQLVRNRLSEGQELRTASSRPS